MSIRPTRLEEAIFDSCLYSNPATSFGINFIDEAQETWVTVPNPVSPNRPSHVAPSGPVNSGTDNSTWFAGGVAADNSMWATRDASAYGSLFAGSNTINNGGTITGIANNLCAAVFNTHNYKTLPLTGGVIDAALVATQRYMPATIVGLTGLGQSIVEATYYVGANCVPISSTSSGSPGRDQAVLMVGDATTSVRATSPILAKYLLLLAARATVLSPSQFSSLARQLRALLSDVDEPTMLDSASSVASFRGLIRFLSAVQPSHPSLSISKSGLFVASWSPKHRAKLSLTFIDYDGGKWFALSLNDFLNHEGKFVTSDFSLPQPFGSWMTR